MVVAALISGILGVTGAVLAALVLTDRVIFTNLLRWRRKLPGGFVIIINGGSGVGKTTIAWALGRRLNVVPVVSTDLIREILRWTIDPAAPGATRSLMTSSFLAYQMDMPDHDGAVDELAVAAFRNQSATMIGPIVRIINRVRTKRDPIIIEGVNVVASDVFEAIPGDQYNGVVLVNLHLDSTQEHLRRLRERGARAREFPELTDRYVRAIRAIRAIDEFLKGDAQICISDPASRESIISIENSGPPSRAVDEIERAIDAKIKTLRESSRKDLR